MGRFSSFLCGGDFDFYVAVTLIVICHLDCDCSHRFIGTQKLSEMLQQPYDLFKPGWADHYILGMVNQVNIWMGKLEIKHRLEEINVDL